MKKNIIIAVLTVTTILSTVYAFSQRAEAKKQEALAVENEKMAMVQAENAHKQMKLAEAQTMMAMQNMMEAVKQKELAEVALKKRK